MSSIIPLIISGIIYLYLSFSFRNINGKPDTKRKLIGKVNSQNNEIVFNKYFENYIIENKLNDNDIKLDIYNKLLAKNLITDKKNINKDIEDSNDNSSYIFTEEEINNSYNFKIGAPYFLNSLSNKLGLTQILYDVFPKSYNKILSLAYYLIDTDSPCLYCDNWVENHMLSIKSHEMSSQRIGELYKSITYNDRINFYNKWSALITENEYCAVDITSISSYSNLIEYVEHGYNREGDKLKQINLCLVFGENSGLPIFSLHYPGSLKDVSTLTSTLDQLLILQDNNFKLVMDKGFYSNKNINYMLKNDKVIEFLIAVPFTNKFAKEFVTNNESFINDNNLISCADDIMYAQKFNLLWLNKFNIYAYVFFNQNLHILAKQALIKKAFMLLNKVENGKIKCNESKDVNKYIISNIKNINKEDKQYKINYSAINKEVQHTGWLIILSNKLMDVNNVINIYRSKDVVGKGFEQLKERLEMRRLRVHSVENMEVKIFISFIAHILLSHINFKMQVNHLYQRFNLKKMLSKLNTIELKVIKSSYFINEPTAIQKEIFKIFDIPFPTRDCRL
jgi:transposase